MLQIWWFKSGVLLDLLCVFSQWIIWFLWWHPHPFFFSKVSLSNQQRRGLSHLCNPSVNTNPLPLSLSLWKIIYTLQCVELICQQCYWWCKHVQPLFISVPIATGVARKNSWFNLSSHSQREGNWMNNVLPAEHQTSDWKLGTTVLT